MPKLNSIGSSKRSRGLKIWEKIKKYDRNHTKYALKYLYVIEMEDREVNNKGGALGEGSLRNWRTTFITQHNMLRQ